MNRSVTQSLILVFFLLFCAAGAQAQIVLAKGEYRIVEIDPPNQRVGVALLEAKPDKRQNWVYVKATTKFVKRTKVAEQTFRDEVLTYDGFFNTINIGDVLRVRGGRGWTGKIHAKEIYF